MEKSSKSDSVKVFLVVPENWFGGPVQKVFFKKEDAEVYAKELGNLHSVETQIVETYIE